MGNEYFKHLYPPLNIGNKVRDSADAAQTIENFEGQENAPVICLTTQKQGFSGEIFPP